MKTVVEATALEGERSGVGSYLINLLCHLPATPDEYCLLLGRGISPWGTYRIQDRYAQLVPGTRSCVLRPFFPYRPRRLTEQPFRRWFLPHYLAAQHADLYFAPNYLLPPRLPAGTRSVITVHDITVLRFPELLPPPLRQELATKLKESCDRADGIIVVSRSTRDDLVELLGIPDDKIKVIYEGTTTPPSLPAAAEDRVLKKLRIKEPFVLYLGNLEPRKNLVRLVKAFRQLAAPFQLVLAGSTAWPYPELYQEIQGEDVVVTGYLRGREVGTLLRRARFFIYPSMYEGFGLPPLEAMSVGCPVVAARAGALPEVLDDAALWVAPESIEDIIQGLDVMWHDQALREHYRQRGFARAARFLWGKTAEETMEYFHQVMR